MGNQACENVLFDEGLANHILHLKMMVIVSIRFAELSLFYQ